MPNFVTFQKFNNIELANDMAQFFVQNNIDCEIEDERNYFDISYSFNKFDFDIKLKIESENFEKAYKALEEYYSLSLENVDSNYYLFEYNTNELLEIVAKPDEWGIFDYLLAKKILQQKNIDISAANILKDKRVEVLKNPTASPYIWIVLGYFGAVFFHFWIYLIGIPISVGVTLLFLKRTLPNGKSVNFFNKSAQKNGTIMLIITLIMLLFWLFFYAYLSRN